MQQYNHAIINYTLHLGDNALILGHRNSEWCGHGPILEQDIALSNIALDLIGQARNFYQYAAELINKNRLNLQNFDKVNGINTKVITEDSLAYLRDAWDFKNCLLVEQPNGDFAKTILRQFLFSAYQYYLYQQLQNSSDLQLAAISEKSLKEVTYHVRWSSEWVIRLGDGTEESHERMLNALDDLWMFTGELFEISEYEAILISDKISVDPGLLRNPWLNKVGKVFKEAGLSLKENDFMQTGGKNGVHTEHLGYILAEMQFLQRAYPDANW